MARRNHDFTRRHGHQPRRFDLLLFANFFTGNVVPHASHYLSAHYNWRIAKQALDFWRYNPECAAQRNPHSRRNDATDEANPNAAPVRVGVKANQHRY